MSSQGARAPERARGVGLIELLVGMAVGSIVLVGALSLAAGQAQRGASSQAHALAMREIEALERLLQRLVRQAVPAAGAADARFERFGGDAGLRFRTRTADGAERQVALRLEAGVLGIQFDGASWQALHDPQALRLAAVSFAVQDDGDEEGATPGCAAPRPPRVQWRLEAAAVGGVSIPVQARQIQVRDVSPTVGCTP